MYFKSASRDRDRPFVIRSDSALLASVETQPMNTPVRWSGSPSGASPLSCAQAVARLQWASGAHAIFDDSPPQRVWRDTQVMTGHVVADWDQARETYAKALLGLEPNDPVF